MRFGKWKLYYTDRDKENFPVQLKPLSSIHCITVAAHICGQDGHALNMQEK